MTPDYPERRNDDRNGSHGPSKKPYGKGNGGSRYGGNKGYGPKDGKKNYRPRDGGYRPRDGNRRSDDRGERHDYKSKGDRRDYKPHDGDRKPYGERRDDRGYGGRSYGDRKPRDNHSDSKDGERREYRPRDDRRDYKPRDGDRKPYGDHRDSERREYRPRDGDRKPYGNHRSDDRGDRREHRPRDDRRDFKPRDGDRRGDRKDFKSRDRGYRDDRRRDRDESERPVEENESRLTIPSTPQKILFKGIDCEINGRADLAMILYLNGAAQMSGGCESNMERMLREMGPSEFKTVRGRLAKNCSDDLMVFFDYLCIDVDEDSDRTFLNEMAESGNLYAIYCKIRLGDVEGEDPMVDTFAAGIIDHEDMVEDGLKLIARKKKSVKAADYLKKNEDRKKLRQSIRSTFVKAMKDDQDSVKRLAKLAEIFPEAEFLQGYIPAYREGTGEGYLKDGMSTFAPTIISMCSEFGINDTAFGKFLAAKKMQVNDEDWVQSMVNAVKAGSDEAMVELMPIQNRRDVKKSLASVYLANGDVEKLVQSYDGEDATYLFEYCNWETDKWLEVGRIMGGVREIDWLKKGWLRNIDGCVDALKALASDETRHCKQLVYTLHDVGAELEAAKLYIEMGDNPTLPTVKWLGKVCEDEAAKQFLHDHFEAAGDLATFESIFVDDGYVRGKKGRPSARSGGFKGNKGGRGRR